MANTKELTPTEIATMSEVVAKYMGAKITNYSCGVNDACFDSFFKEKLYTQIPLNRLDYHSSWDWIHEVWEKVLSEKGYAGTKLDIFKSYITLGLIRSNGLQAFTALYNAIEFINQLKQENGNKSI